MVTDRVGGGGGAGGGGGISMDDIQGMGFATEQWVNEKYLSIDFFNRLFQAYDSEATPNQVLPNDLESTITNIKAMFGFWTEQFVSALGYGPGGGGDTLTEPLASINNASLGMPTAAGQVITWNGSEWIFDIPQGGGGGGTGTVTSITAGTGLSGGTITTSGTISISNEYQTRISHGQQAWQWGNHANMGYLTSSDIADMATKSWVESLGYVTSSGVTSVGLSMPTGFTVNDSPVTSSGTLSVGIASGYFMPTTAQRTTWNNKQDAISDLATIRSNAANGQTAYGWGNHANAGYLLRTEGMRFTDYGNYIAARFVNADGTYDATRAAKAQGEGYIEWWSSGGYFNHVMGFIRAKGNVEVGTSTSDTTHYLQIGGARLYWDNANNALKLIKADGTACNLFATGGVTALQTS